LKEKSLFHIFITCNFYQIGIFEVYMTEDWMVKSLGSA